MGEKKKSSLGFGEISRKYRKKREEVRLLHLTPYAKKQEEPTLQERQEKLKKQERQEKIERLKSLGGKVVERLTEGKILKKPKAKIRKVSPIKFITAGISKSKPVRKSSFEKEYESEKINWLS